MTSWPWSISGVEDFLRAIVEAANKSALMAGAWTTAGAGIGAGMETRAMLGRLKDSGIKGMVKNVAKETAEEAMEAILGWGEAG